jgi:hypothetical protein
MIAGLLVPSMKAQEPTEVTLVQLIANPDRFDGKVIRLSGFLWLEFEGVCSIFIVKITRMQYWAWYL